MSLLEPLGHRLLGIGRFENVIQITFAKRTLHCCCSARQWPVMREPTAAARFDRLLAPVHRWIWRNDERRLLKLLRFGETEVDGGRDILRAAEVTRDPLLRRLYLVHAVDEHRHGGLFRRRAAALLNAWPSSSKPTFQADWIAPGGHGLDDLKVDDETDDTMLAFLHLSEKAAASRFIVYRDVLQSDLGTRAVFEEILHDEMFHMNYTLTQLVRVSPERHRHHLWRARFRRIWKGYLRLATALAGILGGLLLTLQYFIVLPPFAWLAKRAERQETPGWTHISPSRNRSLTNEY
ncbi:MAG TPA: ferritin-like domain-containing protein [Thermoanaerobaculia bacterium]